MWDKLHILREQYISQRIMDSIGYEKFCMISIVYNSSKIEGCTLTETETKVLLENNITAQGKPLTDHLNDKIDKVDGDEIIKFKIFTEDRADYIDSLNATEEKEDLNIFRDFICRQQIKLYESEIYTHSGFPTNACF